MEKREEVKEFLLSKCKILNTYSWSDDRKAYDVPKYVLSDSKTLKLIDQIYNYNEAQLKAKDEQLEMFKSAVETLTEVVLALKGDSKARSIVAMLFWVFAKNRRLHKTNKYFSQDAVTESYFCFQQAYKMLKAQQ